MLISFKLRSPHAPWFIFVLVATLGSIAWYVWESVGQPRLPGGGSQVGLVLGTIGGLVMIFELLLWPRKWPRVRRWRLGRTQVWLRAHIWLGLLTVPLIVLHSGFRAGGLMSTGLLWLFGFVIVSGILGLVLQNIIPRMMIEAVPNETIYSQIDDVSAKACQNAERLVLAVCGGLDETAETSETNGAAGRTRDFTTADAGKGLGARTAFVTVNAVRTIGKTRGSVLETVVAPDVVPHSEGLRVAFEQQVKPYLLKGKWSGSPLELSRKADEYFDNLREGLDPAAHNVVGLLQELCARRRQYDKQVRLHQFLHTWLLVHIPASIVLVGLMFIHVYYALKY